MKDLQLGSDLVLLKLWVPKLFLVGALTANETLHLACMHRLHLLRAHHLWVLQVAQEVLHLVREEPVRLNAPLLFLLLLNLQPANFIADLLLQVVDLPSDTLVEDHNVLKEVHFHLGLLLLKFKNRAPDRLRRLDLVDLGAAFMDGLIGRACSLRHS